MFDNTDENIRAESMHHSSLLLQDIEAARTISPEKGEKLSPRSLHATPNSNLLKKCIHIPIKISETDYIVLLPNIYEYH